MCRKILKNKKGFTLAEALVATLIMLMASSILVAGIPAAKKAYDNVINRSNAEIVMSTAVNALRNELSVARDVHVDKDNKKDVTYLSGTYGSSSKITIDNTKGIMYQRYSTYGGAAGSSDTVSALTRLVSEKASDKMCVKYNTASYDEDNKIITFNGLRVYKKGGSDPVLPEKDLAITTF